MDQLKGDIPAQFLCENPPYAVAIFDRHMRYLFASQKWLSDYGFEGKELVGLSHYDLFTDIPDEWKQIHRRSMQGETVRKQEDRFVRADGTVQWVSWEVRPWNDSEGRIGGILIFAEEVSTRKNLEFSLRESERDFQATFDLAPVGIAHVGLDGKWLRTNRAICEITGYDEEDLKRKTFADITHPDDIEKDWELANRLIRGEFNKYSMEKRYIRKDGSVVWVNLTVAMKCRADGTPDYFITCVDDITEKRRAHQELRASEEKYRSLFERMVESESRFRQIANLMPQLVFTTDPQGKPDYVNERWVEFTGTTVDQLSEDNGAFLVHPDDRKKVEESWAESIRTSSRLDVEFRILNAKTGAYEWFWTMANPLKNSRGEIEKWFGTNTNINEQHLAHEALANRTAELESLLANTPVGLAFLDREHRFVRINPALAAINQIPLERHLGRKLSELLPELDGEVGPLIDRVFETGRLFTTEVRRKRPKNIGVERDWFAGHFPVRDSSGKVVFVGVYVIEITERKRLEYELQEAAKKAREASESKSAFLANMSHEIRTPLGAILGFTELMKDSLIDENERRAHLEVISRNGEQLTTVINDILDLSKIEAGQVAVENLETDPSLIINEVASLLSVRAFEKSIDLTTKSQGEIPNSIGTDPVRFKQILINIVGNAIKFTRDGGVVVKMSFEKGAVGTAGTLIIDVHDTGVGISKEQQSRLFSPFTQANETTTRTFGGTGLGLAISKRLAEALGGTVDLVSSEPSRGSVFRIRIEDRIESAKHRGISKLSTAESGDLSNVRVLLVEDAIDNQNLVSRILTKRNVNVSVASNGLEGVQKALSGNFDVVLMDVQMPVMDGYTATQRLREKGYQKPIIALTAHAMSEMLDRCINVGCSDYLSKPINSKDLIEKIAQHAHA